jgi:hypothetical protein
MKAQSTLHLVLQRLEAKWFGDEVDSAAAA